MANKKINQLVAKTTIQSTDLFPLGDGTTGQLFKKTIAELQAAIGGAVISVNGLVGTVVLDTDDIQELGSPTNKYFTDARARAAISLTVTGNSGASTYSSSTGVLNVPTYTLAGLGGITASFLSGASGIAYNSSTGVITYTGTVYTDASIRALFSAGAGITYNSSTGAISYSGTVYTDSSIRALISLTTSGTSGASTYNNTTGVLNVPTYTLAGLGGISLTSLSGTAPITYNSSTGAIGITQASGAANGFLSSTDWTTFNSKQSTLTLGNVTESVSNVLMFPDGGTNKTVGNLSIQVVQAGSTTNGYLSTTDWTTFNNKQNTITGAASTITTTDLTINRVLISNASGKVDISAVTSTELGYLTGVTSSIQTQLNAKQGTITNPITGTGTAGHVAYFTASGVIAGDAGHFWDNTNKRLGIGTTSPAKMISLNEGTSTTLHTIKMSSSTSPTSGYIGMWFGQLRLTNGSTFNTTSGWVSDATSAPAQLYISSASNNSFISFDTASSNVAEPTERMRITSTGNVGIGTSSPNGYQATSGLMHINSINTNAELHLTNTTCGATSSDGFSLLQYFDQTLLFNLENNAMLFGTNGIERGRFTAGGNLLLGTSTDNGEKLYVAGSIRATGSITANSDVRLKKNIERIENALEKVGQISGYTYNTIYDEDRHAGVIAQEIDKVLPEIVNKGNDGLMGVEYGNISALLIEAIKEQKVLIESLQAKVEALSK